jgi:hypothetical protein
MAFTREELINITRAGFDYQGGVRGYLDNRDVAKIWEGMAPSEREAFENLCVLAEALFMLENDRHRIAEAEERRRREKKRANRKAKKEHAK